MSVMACDQRLPSFIYLPSFAIIYVFFPQKQALPRLSSLFGALLAQTSWLLHHHTLEAFAQFAEVRLA